MERINIKKLIYEFMKVIISVGGRFHSFNLAQQLLKRDYLKKLITSYPKFEVVKYGIPKEKVKTVVLKEILERGWRKLPRFLKNIYNPQYLIHEIFDKLAAKKIEKADIFVGWASFSLNSFKKVKEFKMIKILDEGSSHIIFRRDIVKEEYEKFGVKPELPHPKLVEKELKEYEEADYICVSSLFAKKTFLDKGILENKIIHIPYGVDLSNFQQIKKNDNVFRVIFAGGMTLRKGVHYLLQAFSELNLPNSELMLIGSYNDEIKPFFKKYEGKFNWIGSIPQKELYKYYSQGSVFVLNSIEDGFGMVIIQAMACGLPVIATENTGGLDIISDGKNGFIIPIRNVEALKSKLLYFYQNKEICEIMGQSAKERVSKGFTWDDYGEKIISAYKNILARK